MSRAPDYQYSYSADGVDFDSDVPLSPEEQKQAALSIKTGRRTDVSDYASLRPKEKAMAGNIDTFIQMLQRR